MKIVITGGCGFIGRRLAARLRARGTLAGADGEQAPIDEIVLFDAVPPATPLGRKGILRFVAGDIADRAAVTELIDASTTTIFHFAAVVSAAAEADIDEGLRVNLDGTRAVLDAARALGTAPRVIFASSLAVYGGALPEAVSEATPLKPQTSYGAAKAMGELLVNDYSRKGYIDGRALRFPTIVVRPGRPNRAASSFASALFREPLVGQRAVCPVSPETTMAILSPRRLIAAILALADAPAAAFGADRSVLLPAITVTVAGMVAALERAGGAKAAALIDWQPDPAIQAIVEGWPRALDAARARALGIHADRDIDAIVAGFIVDDLAAQTALAAAS
jgi:D-erythronate 2-dehydrogenase